MIASHDPEPPRTGVAQQCIITKGVSGGEESPTPPPQPCRLSLRHLPSIQLSVRLPPGYPDNEPPTRTTISDADRWLGSERRRAAERKLADLYAGDECLLYILDSVSSTSSEFDGTFSLEPPLILRQVAPAPHRAAPADTVPLSTFLIDYDRQASSAQFATSSHSCPLCFTTQRGSSCIRIASCGCVFCAACLKDYFSLLITEGLVRSVACPSRGCVESRAQWEKDEGASKRMPDRDVTKPGRVTASEVEELVGEEGRKRWEWLQEKARVESGELARHYFPTVLVSNRETDLTSPIFDLCRPCHYVVPSRSLSSSCTQALGRRGEAARLPSMRLLVLRLLSPRVARHPKRLRLAAVERDRVGLPLGRCRTTADARSSLRRGEHQAARRGVRGGARAARVVTGSFDAVSRMQRMGREESRL